MAYPTQSARFADILLAVKARLQARLATLFDLDPTRVVVVKGGGYKLPPYVAEMHVRVRGVRGAYFGDAGAGRTAMLVTRIIAADVFTRSAKDQAGQDEAALTEEDEGHYDREEGVADALVLFWPQSTPVPPAEAANLTVEPLHPSEVPQDADAPEPERYSGWAVSTVYFDCRYVAKFTQ